MKEILLNNHTVLSEPSVATIGFFDGVHSGHRYLIEQVKHYAQKDHLASIVITFVQHPRQLLHPEQSFHLLSSTDMKLLLLSKTGIGEGVVLPFSKTIASLSAFDFMQQVLRDQLNVRRLVIGYDNRFGHNRQETFEDYVRYGREMGIEVVKSQEFLNDGMKVSSSVIRSLLLEGNIRLANKCLGYPFTVVGKVVGGYQEGRKLGFPTANLVLDEASQLLPQPGVYAVWARLKHQMTMYKAMMNIGTRPTFQGHVQTLEVNIFNFSDNIYGQQLIVSFADRLRDEHCFTTPEALSRQLDEDKQQAEACFERLKYKFY